MSPGKIRKVALARGDIFAVKVAPSRWGAVRVAEVQGKSILLATTPYLGLEPPFLEDPLLREVLVQYRFFYRGERASVWVQGRPSENHVRVGNIGPTENDAILPRNTFSGGWDLNTGNAAFLEWRWQHDNAAFRQEVEEANKRAEQARLAEQKPGKLLPDEAFWEIIHQLDWSRFGNDDQVLEPAVKALAALKKTGMRHFQETLAYKLFQLDTRAHAREIGEYAYRDEDTYFSSDTFLYSRCAAVAKGRDAFEAALADPGEMPKDEEFEALLSLADQACERKTGEPLDHDAGCSYESFSNVAGWRKPA